MTGKWAFGKLVNGGISICQRCGEVSLEDDMHWCMNPEADVTDNPIDKIEDEKTWMDFGRQGYYIMKGVMDEGGTAFDAILVIQGFYAGMFKGSVDANREDDDKQAE